MKKYLYIAAGCLFLVQTKALAIPTQITYQGTLKQNGVPVTSPPAKDMTFVLVSPDGKTAYSQIISAQVNVANGLFSIPLNFQLVAPYTWDTITPYIQVSVDGQALGPIEPVNATIYATMAGSVINGAIGPSQLANGAVTWQKIDPTTIPTNGQGFVPPGAIMMFDTDCPSGWTRDAAFDARFPLGGSSYGAMGGTTTHSASISEAVRGAYVKVGTPAGAVNGEYLEDVANQFDERASVHTHTISFDNVTGAAGATFNQLPPYINVIFCKKN